MPNESGKFIRLDRNDEVDVDVGGEKVTFRKIDSCRFEIIAHKRANIGRVRKRIKPRPRLQPNEREKVAFPDDGKLQS